MNISTNADSRTDIIFEWLRDFSHFFFEKRHVTSQKKKNKSKKKEKYHATSQKLCRSYCPHRSRDSLSPVSWIKKNHSLSLFYRFHRRFFFTVFYPFSPFSTAYHWFSKHFTVYHCFFHLKKKFQPFFYHFEPFFLSLFLTVFHHFASGLLSANDERFSVSRMQDFFCKISVLLAHPFW